MIYDVAVDQKDKAMNSLSSIIVSLPSQPILAEKLLAGIKILHLYLYRHLDFIKSVCDRQHADSGFNTESKIITDQIELPPSDDMADRYNNF